MRVLLLPFLVFAAACGEAEPETPSEPAPVAVVPADCTEREGVRSECVAKQTARLEACADGAEEDREGCERDARLLLEVCQDLPETADSLFCNDKNKVCKSRPVNGTDKVAGVLCAGGNVCTKASTGVVCDAGSLWDCYCNSTISTRTQLCDCECVDWTVAGGGSGGGNP